jgi:2-haloacid dehalogenase
LWREKQLAYSWLRTAQGGYVDFEQVTAESLDFALAQYGLGDDALVAKMLRLYRRLDCFGDVRPCLSALRASGRRLAILSNGTGAMLDDLVAAADLSGWFEQLLSVNEVGAFKPDPRVYQLAVDRLALPAERIAFISSNGWDAYAGSAFGFKVFWCNRGGQPAERLPGQPDAVMRSLAELPGLVGV